MGLAVLAELVELRDGLVGADEAAARYPDLAEVEGSSLEVSPVAASPTGLFVVVPRKISDLSKGTASLGM